MKEDEDVSLIDDVRGSESSHLVSKVTIVTLSVGTLMMLHVADQNYRRWAAQNGPFAAYRAHVAGFKSSYQTTRSIFAEAIQLIGDVLAGVETAPARHS
jgi:hypothetical protein